MNPSLQTVSLNGFGIKPSVRHDRLVIALTGTADLAAVPSVRACLAAVPSELNQLGLKTLEVDIRQLYFLNSSCLKAFVAFVYRIYSEGVDITIQFVVDAHLGWQNRALSALERMAPRTVTIQVC